MPIGTIFAFLCFWLCYVDKTVKFPLILGMRKMSWFWLFVLFISLIWMVVTNAQHLH